MWRITTGQTVLVDIQHDFYSQFQELPYNPSLHITPNLKKMDEYNSYNRGMRNTQILLGWDSMVKQKPSRLWSLTL